MGGGVDDELQARAPIGDTDGRTTATVAGCGPLRERRWARKHDGRQVARGQTECRPYPAAMLESSASANDGDGASARASRIETFYGPVTLSGAGRGRGGGNYPSSLTAGAYAAGQRVAYETRCRADLARLYARPDMPASARWVDAHCHLESILARSWRGGGKSQVIDHEPNHDLQQLVASWPEGLDGCVCNCASLKPSKPGFPSEWSWLKTNFHHFEEGPTSGKLWFTIGLHPHDASLWDSAAEETLRRLGAHPKCVGIGECGLDFFRHDKKAADLQLQVFKAQIRLAVELKKALVIHARLVAEENEELFLRVLEKDLPQDHPVHMHCYSDSLGLVLELCRRWQKLRVGFTGAITFRDAPQRSKGREKGNGKISVAGVVEKKGEEHCRELVQGLPAERLLLETDGPYMCPEPFRGQTAHPGHVHRVAERIAAWQGKSLGDVMAATRASTVVVYGI
eukprot:TRINITY_DN31902_c0_g1_i1.p1 TRINITY_DN31902_c0_g1~~TRINITY_DN31902_c0_g1_i1.p1  ORF type:complete len:455 (+),score=53.52 TRINITY_DN31902_c0_g1_i1:57-1421(+)